MYDIGIKPEEAIPMTKEELKELETTARELTLLYLQKRTEEFTSEENAVKAYNESYMKIKGLLLSQLSF